MFFPVSAVDAVNFTFFAVIFIVTGLRIICRSYVSPTFGLDDGFVTIAMVSSSLAVTVSSKFVDIFQRSLDLRMLYWCTSNIVYFKVSGRWSKQSQKAGLSHQTTNKRSFQKRFD